eukprot:3827048-Prymnesium_polylepis.1
MPAQRRPSPTSAALCHASGPPVHPAPPAPATLAPPPDGARTAAGRAARHRCAPPPARCDAAAVPRRR